VTEDISIGDRVRELRRRRGLTQEDLAQQAGLSVQVVQKLEQGRCSVRFETLHAIARVLGAQTVALVVPGLPEPPLWDQEEGRDAVMLEIREAIIPPARVRQPAWVDLGIEAPDLPRLRDAASRLARLYHVDRYGEVARLAPALVRSADYHVAALDGAQDAVATRAYLLGIVGRYLIQVRQHDLGLVALRRAIADAQQIEDVPLLSSLISRQAWGMMRQGRLATAERVAAEWAEELEPRLSRARPEQLAAWGVLLRRAAGAAIRNNRPDIARDLTSLATTVATRLDRETGEPGLATFGPVTATIQRVENELLQDRPDQALKEAESMPPDAPQYTTVYHRHRVDVARAAVMVGDVDRATEIMAELKQRAPEWLRYQRAAREVVRDIVRRQPRTLTDVQRSLADHLNVDG